MQDIYTFSIKRDDSKSLKTVEAIKSLCEQNGLTFSYVVLEALKEHLPKLKEKHNG